jgi:hypothetical protein
MAGNHSSVLFSFLSRIVLLAAKLCTGICERSLVGAEQPSSVGGGDR